MTASCEGAGACQGVCQGVCIGWVDFVAGKVDVWDPTIQAEAQACQQVKAQACQKVKASRAMYSDEPTVYSDQDTVRRIIRARDPIVQAEVHAANQKMKAVMAEVHAIFALRWEQGYY